MLENALAALFGPKILDTPGLWHAILMFACEFPLEIPWRDAGAVELARLEIV